MKNSDQIHEQLEQLISSYFSPTPKQWSEQVEGREVNHTSYYIISTGDKAAQLTLWSYNSVRMFKPYQYITNMPNDPQACFDKLKSKYGSDVCVMIDQVTQNDRAQSYKVLKFGKHKGEHIESVIENDLDYAVWMYEKACEKSANLYDSYPYHINEGRYYVAVQEAIADKRWDCIETRLDKALMQEYGETLSKASEQRRAARLAEMKAKQAEQLKGVEKISDGRQEITVKISSIKIYENDFGTQVKALYIDEKGRKFFGTIPSALSHLENALEAQGLMFTITANVTPKEDYFAFIKRPHVKSKEVTRIEQTLKK